MAMTLSDLTDRLVDDQSLCERLLQDWDSVLKELGLSDDDQRLFAAHDPQSLLLLCDGVEPRDDYWVSNLDDDCATALCSTDRCVTDTCATNWCWSASPASCC